MADGTNLCSTKRELEDALACINTDNGPRSNRPNIYDITRNLRRIDRALTKMETIMENGEVEMDASSASVSNANRNEEPSSLDTPAIDCLLNVLVDLPTRLNALHIPPLSDEIQTNSTSDEDSTQRLYRQSISTACRIIRRYVDLPLTKSQMDRLLDRIANMVLHKDIQYDIIRTLNRSLVAMDCRQQLEKESHPHTINEDHSFKHSNPSNISPFLLDAGETVFLTELFVKLSITHLNVPWTSKHFIPHEYDNDGSIHENRSQQQDNEVQLRILLSYLFHHMATLPSLDSSNGHQRSCSLDEKLRLIFERSCMERYQSNERSQTFEEDRLTAEQSAREMQQDYMDLMYSFSIQIIEYSLEVIQKSDDYLRANYDDSVVEDLVRDVFLHTSLAVRFVELLHHVQMPMSNLIHHHINQMWDAYAKFVASFCLETVLQGGMHNAASLDEVEDVAVFLSSMDDVLFRICHIADQKTSLQGNKRMRHDQTGKAARNLGNAKMITLLRAFAKARGAATQESTFDAQLWDSLLRVSPSISRHDLYHTCKQRGRINEHGCRIGGENRSAIGNDRPDPQCASTIQAMLLTNIVLPSNEMSTQSKVSEKIEESLIKSLTNSSDEGVSLFGGNDALNPWNSILKRRLFESKSNATTTS